MSVRVSKKFVVCLTLLLAMATGLAAGLLARPCPALAVWGDNNEPMPVLFGLQLGGDIREHPELEMYRIAGLPSPKGWGKGAAYEGIPASPYCYTTFDNKIASVSFFIKPEDFPRFRELMRRDFGNEILRGEEDRNDILEAGYYWGKYEIEICAPYPFENDEASITFSYLPLDNQYIEARYQYIPKSFDYHHVTLGQKVEDCPLLHPIKEEAPDIVYYKSDEPPLVFEHSSGTTYVESETWLAYKGVIYSLELRGDTSSDRFLAEELAEIYELRDYQTATIASAPELRLGEYTIYFKPGLTVTTHLPTYWAMLRAKARLGK